MAWLIFPIALFLVIVAGVRALRSKGVVADRARDEALVHRWERARRNGFILHCLRTTAPLVFGYYGLVPLVQAWRQTGVPTFPFDRLSILIVSAGITTLLVGAYF